MVVERQSSMQSGSGGGSLLRPRRGDAYRQVSYGRREVGRPAKHAGSGYESARLEARTGAKLVGKPVAVPNHFNDCLSSRDRKEHTSELQSRQYLVCRLLLEKKKHVA